MKLIVCKFCSRPSFSLIKTPLHCRRCRGTNLMHVPLLLIAFIVLAVTGAVAINDPEIYGSLSNFVKSFF